MKKFCCLVFIFVLLMACTFNVSAASSPDIMSLYRIDCDYIEKSDMAVGLEIVDIMKVYILWDAYDERELIEADVEFPFVPEDLTMVILTNGIDISHAFWEVTSDHSLRIYFFKEDLEPFIESEVVYLMMIRYQDGIFYRLY